MSSAARCISFTVDICVGLSVVVVAEQEVAVDRQCGPGGAAGCGGRLRGVAARAVRRVGAGPVHHRHPGRGAGRCGLGSCADGQSSQCLAKLFVCFIIVLISYVPGNISTLKP